MKTVDRAFGWLMVVGGTGHAIGSVIGLAHKPDVLVWALSGSLAAWLLAALNLMRVNRPMDRTLAWVCTGGSIASVFIALGFGISIGNALDPRAIVNALRPWLLMYGVSSFIIIHGSWSLPA